MVFKLMLKGLRTGKARFACAVVGLAVAVGTLVFMTSLVATNNAQAPLAAQKGCAPWAAWRTDGVQLGFRRKFTPPGAKAAPDSPPRAEARSTEPSRPPAAAANLPRPDLRLKGLGVTIDYRPGGRVLQGPPMRAFLAEAPATNVYGGVSLGEGRWVDEAADEMEVVCVRAALRRFGREPEPPLGSSLKFVGQRGTMTAKVVGYLDGVRLPREFPNVFANRAAFAAFADERPGSVSLYRNRPETPGADLLTAASPRVVAAFRSDEQKRMDYATPLLLAAAFLTALSLLVNSLLLSVESNRATLATLRTVGLTRLGVVAFVACESVFAGLVGWALGVVGAVAALAVYVSCDAVTFPAGWAVDSGRIRLTLAILPLVILLAVLFALAPALKVRAMDVAQRRPRRRRRGMAITFACGFAAFAAVEVWGASLMRAFVPSPEWPDAIVSILPAGVSSWDVEKLRDVKGVRRISELVPRQLPLATDETRNALFLAAEFLPKFRFVEGSWESADEAVRTGDAVVITEMTSNAYGLHKGDVLKVVRPGRRGEAPTELSFPVAGVVDLNWHMVTSRGLVRGLNGAPGMTDGPVFCSLDTMGAVDFRTFVADPAMSAPMTHLWVDYDAAFLKEHGVFPAGRLVEAEIARRLGNPVASTVRLHARDEVADGTLAHGNDVIGQAARVPFVFLAILAVGFVAMLVAEADSRRREFAILRAVGATKAQLAGRLALSAVKTALVGIAAGLPVGALVGWLFTFKTGAIWPGLPHWFVVPWRVTAEGAVGAVAFALAFAVPTALALVRRATRRNVAGRAK